MRLFVLLFSLVLLPFSLCAEEAGRIYTVGFAQDNMKNDYRAAQVNEMKAALAPYPFIRFIHTDAQGNKVRQMLDLNRLDKKGADILVTSPASQNVMKPALTELFKRKPVVILTRKPSHDHFTSFAGADDYAIAREAATLIAKKLNGKGRVVMFKGLATATTAIAREKGFLEELKKYPEIEVVASAAADYVRDKAISEMDKLLSKKIAFDAIYAHSDSMAVGARQSMERAGLDPADYVIVGIDYIPEAKAAIRAGKQTASFTYPTAGKEGASIVLKLIRGEAVERYVDVPFTLVTSENVDSVSTIFK